MDTEQKVCLLPHDDDGRRTMATRKEANPLETRFAAAAAVNRASDPELHRHVLVVR